MASDGGMLKDSRVKLFLSSRTEMQKIIEETRQQHLALQAATGMANIIPMAASMQRPFTSGPFAPIPGPAAHVPTATPVRPAAPNTGNNSFSNMDSSQGHLGSYEQQMFQSQQQQQSHQLYNQNQRMLLEGTGQNPMQGFPPHMNQPQPYAPQGSQCLPQQQFGPRMRGANGNPPLGPYGGQQHMPGPVEEPGGVFPHHTGERLDQDRRNSPLDTDRHRDVDRGGYRSRDRNRRDRESDKDKGRGRRSRSRSGSRGRGRDRRRRSRSDSRDRRKNSRDRDRNGKSGKSGLLPTPAEQMQGKGQQNEAAAADTSVQFRLLAGDLTYRDIRDYLHGITLPNTCIKMINALDGYRFGLAYIRLTSRADKQKALSRHNGNKETDVIIYTAARFDVILVLLSGMIRGYPVQIFHVEDSTFNQAIDSYSPGVALDAKILSRSCLSLRDFPPVAGAHNVREAFGTISIGQVLPERNEIGTVTGLCYAELSSEADARKAIQLLKDGVLICGRQVKVAFLPLEELHVCGRNLERLRVGVQQKDSPLSPGYPGPHRPAVGGRPGPAFHDGQRPQPGPYDPPQMQRGRPYAIAPKIFLSGLPPSAMERDIGDFFSDVGVIPQVIEIVYDEERLPVGNAYCQFANMQEAERALDKNGGFMGGCTVSVALVDGYSGPAGGGHHPNEDMSHYTQPYSDPAINQPDHGAGGGYGHLGPNDPYHRPPMGNDGGNGYNNTQMAPRFGGPRFGGPRYPPGGGGGRGNHASGPRARPSMNARMRMQGGPMQNGGRGGGSDDGSPTPGFGAPGCVVALANVPHKAIIADILDFFRGFQVNEKCVLRRFGHNGEPTGDARVAFPSPDEADLAVRTLQNEYLLNRRVVLSIV